MKKFKFAFLAIIAVVTLSCSSSSSSDDNGGGSDDLYIKFKVNGTQSNMLEPSTIVSMAASIFGSEDVGDNIRTLILRTPSTAEVGTHDIVDAPADLTSYGVSYSFSVGDISVDATSGTMTITSIGAEYMTGTFTCSGTYEGTTYNFTEGTFRVFKPVPTN